MIQRCLRLLVGFLVAAMLVVSLYSGYTAVEEGLWVWRAFAHLALEERMASRQGEIYVLLREWAKQIPETDAVLVVGETAAEPGQTPRHQPTHAYYDPEPVYRLIPRLVYRTHSALTRTDLDRPEVKEFIRTHRIRWIIYYKQDESGKHYRIPEHVLIRCGQD